MTPAATTADVGVVLTPCLLPWCRLEEPLLPPVQQREQEKQRQRHAAHSAGDPEAALLAAADGGATGGWQAAREVFEELPPQYMQSSLWDTTINLTNAVLGAGMLAMPHAFAGLGVLGGGEPRGRGCGRWSVELRPAWHQETGGKLPVTLPLLLPAAVTMTVAVALMTHASIAVMLRSVKRRGGAEVDGGGGAGAGPPGSCAGGAPISEPTHPPCLPSPASRRPTERTGKLTYASVMEAEWGRAAGVAVRISIVGGSAGFLVLYLIVLADLLVGEDLAAVREERGGHTHACCCATAGPARPATFARPPHITPAGTEEWSGIIPDLWPDLPDPLPWYLQRTAMLTWATALVSPVLRECGEGPAAASRL